MDAGVRVEFSSSAYFAYGTSLRAVSRWISLMKFLATWDSIDVCSGLRLLVRARDPASFGALGISIASGSGRLPGQEHSVQVRRRRVDRRDLPGGRAGRD